MKFLIFLTFGILNAVTMSAQDLSFLKIPAELLVNANSVKRYETLEITIKSPAVYVVKQRYAYTILNEKGAGFAEFNDYYDVFRSLDDIEGRLLDKYGKELKKVRKKDISDVSSEGGISVSDDRYKVHNFNYSDYPYTVEYSVTAEMKGAFYYPSWIPQWVPSQSVQSSRLVVNVPAAIKIRHKGYNFKGVEKVQDLPSGKRMEWEVSDMVATIAEPMMPGWGRVRTKIALAPNEFEIDGFKGKMTSWNEFGAFLYQLTEGRDKLPDAIAQKAKQLTAGISDNNEKIRILYDFLQKNTRYISVQLGIGGWQPIPAAKVASTGYGDCKALSNYMMAMLKEVGIVSRYTVIKSQDEGVYTDVDFVSNQFDHVILCVPNGKDTVWLECTSNILPAGYLGEFTGNRPALIVDKDGGKMVRTPTYKKSENLQSRVVQAVVSESGDMLLKSNTVYTGLQQDDLEGFVSTASKDAVLKMLRARFSLPTYEIDNYKYEEDRGRIPKLKEQIDISVQAYAQVSGKRLMLVPNILSKSGVKFAKDTARKYDIELDYDYLDTDTFYVKIPEGYEVESLPKPASVKTVFGEYESQTAFKDNEIVFTRSVSQNSGRYPAAEFNKLVEFYESIYKYDRAKAVLRKKE
jgi:transglutaminase-like putative cysteine protease